VKIEKIKNKTNTISITLASLMLLGGCADKSSEISATYGSPLAYKSYDCDQLEQEYLRLQRRGSEIMKSQDDTASDDSVAMGVGLVLFWPALFFIDSDDAREEVGRIKGELEAVEQASIQKKCLTLSSEISKTR
jgi:hypothetical protein